LREIQFAGEFGVSVITAILKIVAMPEKAKQRRNYSSECKAKAAAKFPSGLKVHQVEITELQ
jgi:hypothetical protein